MKKPLFRGWLFHLQECELLITEIIEDKMRRLYVFTVFLTGFVTLYAQSHMRIHHKGGGHCDVTIEQIDNVMIVGGSDSPVNEGSLGGS